MAISFANLLPLLSQWITAHAFRSFSGRRAIHKVTLWFKTIETALGAGAVIIVG